MASSRSSLIAGLFHDDGDGYRESSEIETTPRPSEETLPRSSASVSTERLV